MGQILAVKYLTSMEIKIKTNTTKSIYFQKSTVFMKREILNVLMDVYLPCSCISVWEVSH